MKISKRNINGIFVLSLLIIICVCAGNVMSLYSPNDTAEAFTYSAISAQSTDLGEMLVDGYENDTTGAGKVFVGDIFWELIRQITGEQNPNKNKLNNLTMPKTSADFRGYNNGLDVVVTIGGRQWTATYLSANSSGDPILTFWVATYDGVYSRWHSQEVNRSGDYPNNMYGTSEIRAVALNNGGGYAATYNATSLTYVNQDENNDWAIYTMDSVSGSLTSFIEVPDNMSWQHNQRAKDSAGQSYNYNNDALNSGMGSFYDDDHCYESKTGYANWANDKVWLPSIAETGENNESGIWMVSKNQRASDTHTWTRSGYYNNYYRSFRHLSSGTGESYGNISAVAWGRPAFHLNLKKAAERAENLKIDQPTNVTLEYTGRALTLADVSAEHKSWYDSAKISLEYPAGGMKDAGTYTVTANIKEDFISNHEFSGEPDASKGETPTTRKFNFTITKKKIGVDLT
ncbi:MAG: hypothetical protein K2I78_03685, partial [Clostridia bacterium]|nr:hypothetical protein [Clostridia bacterium]